MNSINELFKKNISMLKLLKIKSLTILALFFIAFQTETYAQSSCSEGENIVMLNESGSNQAPFDLILTCLDIDSPECPVDEWNDFVGGTIALTWEFTGNTSLAFGDFFLLYADCTQDDWEDCIVDLEQDDVEFDGDTGFHAFNGLEPGAYKLVAENYLFDNLYYEYDLIVEEPLYESMNISYDIIYEPQCPGDFVRIFIIL